MYFSNINGQQIIGGGDEGFISFFQNILLHCRQGLYICTPGGYLGVSFQEARDSQQPSGLGKNKYDAIFCYTSGVGNKI